MDLKRTFFRFSIFIILAIPFIFTVITCSTPAWFPIKKGPPYKAKTKELLDKEVVIIDKKEYVKVYNPKASEGRDQPKYLYVPVDEYLSKRDTFTTPLIRKVEGERETSVSPMKPSALTTEREFPPKPLPITTIPDLKKKVMVAYFDDRTTDGDEVFGDWVAERLINEINRRSQRVIIVDYQMVKEFLKKRGFALTDLERPQVLHLLNEVFGLHAIMVGELSGPYTFITKVEKSRDETASAIVKIEMRLVDTLSGKTQKNFSAKNPITATKEKGSFSEEKAKIKAIDLTLSDLSRSLLRELDGLDWYCRIAKVEGDEVYINAGRLTGLKVGDVMEVFHPGGPGERGEVKGKIQISTCFGIDASMGRLMNGKKPDVNDILRLAKREET
jgi:hypothetical protein